MRGFVKTALGTGLAVLIWLVVQWQPVADTWARLTDPSYTFSENSQTVNGGRDETYIRIEKDCFLCPCADPDFDHNSGIINNFTSAIRPTIWSRACIYKLNFNKNTTGSPRQLRFYGARYKNQHSITQSP